MAHIKKFCFKILNQIVKNENKTRAVLQNMVPTKIHLLL